MAATRMRFTGTGTGTYYIDLAKALSIQNRKLHRQKNIYTVYGGYFVDAAQENGTSRVDVAVAPNTWTVRRSINRAFAIWRKMIAKTISDSNGVKPGKYSDFKIFLNYGHGTTPLTPKDANGNDLYATAPEWVYSALITEDPLLQEDVGSSNPAGSNLELGQPDQFNLQIVGPTVTASPGDHTRIGVLQSWVDSRPQQHTSGDPILPAAASTDPLANLFDAGDVQDDRIELIDFYNDQAPYDESTMFGNAASAAPQNNLMRVSTSVSTATQHVAPVHGFEAVCGLVQIDVVRAEGDWEIVLDVESKGVKF